MAKNVLYVDRFVNDSSGLLAPGTIQKPRELSLAYELNRHYAVQTSYYLCAVVPHLIQQSLSHQRFDALVTHVPFDNPPAASTGPIDSSSGFYASKYSNSSISPSTNPYH